MEMAVVFERSAYIVPDEWIVSGKHIGDSSV